MISLFKKLFGRIKRYRDEKTAWFRRKPLPESKEGENPAEVIFEDKLPPILERMKPSIIGFDSTEENYYLVNKEYGMIRLNKSKYVEDFLSRLSLVDIGIRNQHIDPDKVKEVFLETYDRGIGEEAFVVCIIFSDDDGFSLISEEAPLDLPISRKVDYKPNFTLIPSVVSFKQVSHLMDILKENGREDLYIKMSLDLNI